MTPNAPLAGDILAKKLVSWHLAVRLPRVSVERVALYGFSSPYGRAIERPYGGVDPGVDEGREKSGHDRA